MKKIKILTCLSVIPNLAIPVVATSCSDMNITTQIYDSAIDYIKEIATIPHVSNDPDHRNSLEQMNAYLMNTAKQYVIPSTVQTDDVGNVWYDIPASSGCESYKKLALQAHMDMVWAAQGEATEWDKWTHPCSPAIVEKIEGVNVLHSQDYLTNIGTDDSCGMAYMLAITKHHGLFKHGPIRCIFTTNEENGEPGSESLGKRRNKGDINVLDHNEGWDYLINIDSGPLGTVVFNAAGGYLGDFKDDEVETESVTGHDYTLSISDCLGGHSGENIDDGRINCLKTIAEMITALNGLNIYAFETPNCTGTSIPTGVNVHFISSLNEQDIHNVIDPIFKKAKDDYLVEELMTMNLKLEAQSATKDCLSINHTYNWFNFIKGLDYGPLAWYEEPDEHHALRSSANLGPLTIDLAQTTKISLHVAARYQEKTDLDTGKQKYDEAYGPIAADTLQCIYTSGAWNPWDGRKDNPICNKSIEAYKEIGIEGIKGRVHGGLECADFIQFNDQLNVVSLGPTNKNEHSVYETLDLDSYIQFVKMMDKMLLKMEF